MERNLKLRPFFDHLEELRFRLIRSLVVFVLVCFAVSSWVNGLLQFLMKPVGRLVFTAPAEGFLAYLTINCFLAFLVSLPYLLFELWGFVSAALSDEEKKSVVIFAPLSLIFFLSGVAFGYFIVIPLMFSFFLSFSSESMVPMITVKQYISFMASFCLSFGIIFELPLVFVFLTKIGIATPDFLIQKRRHAIVAIFVVSALLTPPDYVSQLLMALPMMALYEIGILLSKMVYRPRFQLKV